MKKILSIALAVVMLATLGTAFAVSADEPATFLVSHYNDGAVEGAGVIFTTEDTAGAWWIHVAFAPIEGTTNAYEIVEYVNGTDGSGVALAIPEGGFVWAANTGNNWPELIANAKGDEWYYDDAHKEMPNYVNDNCTNSMAMAATWAVGDQFVIEGVDFENIPTSTPDKQWYEEGYVCTATIAPYVPGSEPAPESSEPAPESSEEAVESSEEAVESSEEAVESSEAPATSSEAPKTGDAGILVFAVLAVVAVAGCAIAVKVRG